MSWQLKVDTDNAVAVVKLSNGDTRIDMQFAQQLDVAETDNAICIVFGRCRPYGEDYLSTSSAAWLATAYVQYGVTLPEHIAGFFVALLIDKPSNRILLINDHVGSIACYVTQKAAEHVVLSDTLTPVQGSALCPQALFHYVFYHCIPSPHSIYQHTTKLEPGVTASWQPTTALSIQNYYQPDFTPAKQSTEQLMAKCRELVSEAVRRNISDNCAAFLSGGLDSSTVAGMLAKHSEQAKTYSIGFDAKGYDETEYALITAKHFNTQHQVHYLQPEEIEQHFNTVASHFTEPFGNSSAMAAYICAKNAKADGISVMLAGDGGDEIFAGNERYVKQKVFEHYTHLPGPVQKLLDIGLDNSIAAALPGLKKACSYVRQAKVPLPDRLDSYNFVNRFNLKQMFSEKLLAQVDTDLAAQQKRSRYQACRSNDAVDRMMYLDWKFTLADNDLVKVSRMCQLAGVEVRFPLFEKELVDFSCTVPAELKAPGQKLRDFYKNSFRGFLPDETLSKSKHGFGLPFGVWMKQRPALNSLALDALEAFKKRNILQSNFIDTAIITFRDGHAGYYGELVWIIVVLELWLQQHGANYAA